MLTHVLISPRIDLPTLSSEEELQIRFWHWFNQFPQDPGRVQVSTDNGANWTSISRNFVQNGNAWTQHIIDISEYANSTVRFAFYFTSDGGSEANGWFVDDISIVKGVFRMPNPEGFELGIGDWNVEQGVWEVGIPTRGPASAHTGENCAGTVLGGNYPRNADTRLISPRIDLPTLSSEEELQIRFWHWFNQFPQDPGRVQVSTDNGANWTSISRNFVQNGNAWTQHIIDISEYANSTVRFAFYFTSDGGSEANGWFVDDISIVKGVFRMPNPEGFELGIGDWNVEQGVWEVGIPTRGPASAHTGENCAGTVLGGNYPRNADTRLISPELKLVPILNESPELFFWQWFNQFPQDSAVVQISTEGGEWQTISNSFSSNSGGWTQFFIDLSRYANSTVRLAFYFTSDGGSEANGWFIDDIRIEGIQTNPGPDPIENIRLLSTNPSTNQITIKNFGNSAKDISDYRLCSKLVYTQNLRNQNIETGSLNLGPNQEVTISGFGLDVSEADLSLYLPIVNTGNPNVDFTDPAIMVDFTQWGSAGNGRESVAAAKGIWTTGDFISTADTYNYIGNGSQNGLNFWVGRQIFDCPNLNLDIGDVCNDGNANTSNDRVQQDCTCSGEITFDCPDLSLNIGDSCDDNNANTSNDRVQQNCSCSGQVVFDCPDLNMNIGDNCDDNNSNTSNDRVQQNCSCQGEVIFDCPDLSLNIGDSCDDNDPNTSNDQVQQNCSCAGEVTFDCPDLNLNIGNSCDDNDANTSNDRVQQNCSCAGEVTFDCPGLSLDIGDSCDDNNMNTSNDRVQQNCSCSGDITFDCPDLSLNIGDSCDDNDANTANDRVLQNCNCQGEVTFDCPDLSLNIGDSCDDNNANTSNDRVQQNCSCQGDIVFDCPDLSLNIGDSCDDNNANTSNDRVQDNCICAGEVTFDCPNLGSNFGDACNDGNENTDNDRVLLDCICAGEIVFDCPDLNLNIGDSCNDGNDNTSNDRVQQDCSCQGSTVFDCPNLGLNIGDTCNDNNPNTSNDTVDQNCNCSGQTTDCEGITGGSAIPGTSCDDGESKTLNDVYDENCICRGINPDCDCEGMEVITVCQNGQTKRVNCNALSDPQMYCGPCQDSPAVCKECDYNADGTLTICWIPSEKDNFRTITGDCDFLQNFFDSEGNMMNDNECGPCQCAFIGDVDSDGDGICDRKDECPNDASRDKAGLCGCDDQDSDTDGICDDDDCAPSDNSLPASATRSCDDGDPNTENDVIVAGSCDCSGSTISCPDSDGDGVCNDDDICEGSDDHADADNDGTPNGCDECPDNADKTVKGVCGCENCPVDDCNDICQPRGNAEYEWIDKISMNQLENQSGSNDGYGDFRDQFLELGQGDSLSLWVFHNHLENICEKSVHIYADWNGDCDFDDEGELVHWERTLNEAGTYIAIPDDAIEGDITIRFMVHYGRIRSACQEGIEGEVEDYTLRIFSRNNIKVSSQDQKSVEHETDQYKISVFPNPISEHNSFLLEHNLDPSELMKIKIFTLDGQLVSTFNLNGSQHEFSTKNLHAGVYIVEIKTDNVVMREVVVVQR